MSGDVRLPTSLLLALRGTSYLAAAGLCGLCQNDGRGRMTREISSAIRLGRRVEASAQHHELRTSAARSSPRLNIVVKAALEPRAPVAVTSAATLSPRNKGIR